MTDIWTEDACALVDAYRKRETSPEEIMDAALTAAGRSGLNAISYIDEEEAHAAAKAADISLPFGGVPFGVKELDPVDGWPFTEASKLFAGRTGSFTRTMLERLSASGAILAGQTTASEFGSMNYTSTPLHGTTRNPWDTEATPGGSSGGSAASVAGGIFPIATGGDGGGSIRIPAGFTGLFGLKTTYGVIPKGPWVDQSSLTVVYGCVSRSVRDTARFIDVCSGYDPHDALSLPKGDDLEARLGSHDLSGMRACIAVDLGCAVVAPYVVEIVENAARALIEEAGLKLVDVVVTLPGISIEWAMSNIASLMAEIADLYPERAQELTPELQFIMNIADHTFDLRSAASVCSKRVELNETMAGIFEQVDFVFAATNPDIAFAAAGPPPTTVGGRDLATEIGFEAALGNHGALTIPSNLYGNPAISLPVGLSGGLPVGMQVLARHHADALLLDLGLLAERLMPWPLVAPAAPC